MRRRRVEVPVGLLDVFAVVALAPGEAEQPLLEDRVGLVPERDREAEPAVIVGDAEQAVLGPAVGPRPGVFVGQVVPRLAVGRVVLADRSPFPVGEVGSPAIPGGVALVRVGETDALRVGLGHARPRHVTVRSATWT